MNTALAAHLDARGWTSVHLCAALRDAGRHVHPMTVERWIRGDNQPRLSTARLIADLLGTTLDDLVRDAPCRS